MKAYALLLALLMGACSCASLPSHQQLHDLTLRLEFAHGGVCSGTAIGADVILSATHCFRGEALVKVNGTPVKVVGYGKDKHDLSTARITGLTFKRWAKFGPALKQGDRIRWWGNPHGEPDVYREGYVSRVKEGLVLVDATICHGDSGAGIFNEAGQVVGVVSAMSDLSGCTFMAMFPMVKT